MSDLTFHLHAPGSMDKHAKLYTLGAQTSYYDSLCGLLPARFVSVVDANPETLEDGSLAPWVDLHIQVEWPDLGWMDEVFKAESLIPRGALYGEYSNKIASFRWRAP